MLYRSHKNPWTLFLLLLAGIVAGGLLGEYLGAYPAFKFMRYGFEFGLKTPLFMDLKVLKITLGVVVDINTASIAGIIISLLVFKKI